jgi:iron complex transport system substrate-binding protein
MNNKKIVSLLPAATEIVCALGLQDNLVGRSHECDFPETINNVPLCTEAVSFFTSHSHTGSQQAQPTVANALSGYIVNSKVIKNLNPDIVLTQAQHNGRNILLSTVLAQLQSWAGVSTQLISLNPCTLAQALSDIATIAAALGVPTEGKILLESLYERLDLVKHKLKFFPDKPKVACIEWLSPILLGGSWIPEMVEIAGGKPIMAQNGQPPVLVDWEAIKAENPEIILIMPCGFTIQRTLQQIHTLTTLPGWATTNAVKNNRIYIADGNAYFNRSGPRLIDSVEILAEIINPKYLNYGYQGTGWIKFEC